MILVKSWSNLFLKKFQEHGFLFILLFSLHFFHLMFTLSLLYYKLSWEIFENFSAVVME